MTQEFEIKMRGVLGGDKTDDKTIRILNRCVEWVGDEIHYEADPRHEIKLIEHKYRWWSRRIFQQKYRDRNQPFCSHPLYMHYRASRRLLVPPISYTGDESDHLSNDLASTVSEASGSDSDKE